MSEQQKPEIGSLGWFDLTVPDAEKVRDFYSKVIGWLNQVRALGRSGVTAPDQIHDIRSILESISAFRGDEMIDGSGWNFDPLDLEDPGVGPGVRVEHRPGNCQDINPW